LPSGETATSERTPTVAEFSELGLFWGLPDRKSVRLAGRWISIAGFLELAGVNWFAGRGDGDLGEDADGCRVLRTRFVADYWVAGGVEAIEAVTSIGIAAANVVTILHPQRIVFSGGRLQLGSPADRHGETRGCRTNREVSNRRLVMHRIAKKAESTPWGIAPLLR
jgi:hypothetical protein